jgi:hypothetical protein
VRVTNHVVQHEDLRILTLKHFQSLSNGDYRRDGRVVNARMFPFDAVCTSALRVATTVIERGVHHDAMQPGRRCRVTTEVATRRQFSLGRSM